MKRPAAIGGRPLPKRSGRCALCHHPIDDPRDGAVTLVYADPPAGKASFQTVCKDRQACHARQQREQQP